MELDSTSKKQILKFIRPVPNSMFNVHNHHEIKLLTRLLVELSHLHGHKLRQFSKLPIYIPTYIYIATAVGILTQLFTSFFIT